MIPPSVNLSNNKYVRLIKLYECSWECGVDHHSGNDRMGQLPWLIPAVPSRRTFAALLILLFVGCNNEKNPNQETRADAEFMEDAPPDGTIVVGDLGGIRRDNDKGRYVNDKTH